MNFSLPSPPLNFCPWQCALRAQLNTLRESRALTPRVLFVRGGLDNAAEFDAQLIEARRWLAAFPALLHCILLACGTPLQRRSQSHVSLQEPDVEGFGFVSFLDIVAMQASELLRS